MRLREKTAAQSRELSRDLAVCGLFAALITVGAFIRVVIPAGADTMNFTLQWFFVLLAGLLLGSRRAFLSVAAYLLIGLLGVPVFARGGGPAYLLKPTFGFLLGFALAAWAMGRLTEMRRPCRAGALLLTATAGYFLYYGAGMIWFFLISRLFMAQPVGWGTLFAVYCLPTMIPDYILCVLAVTAARRLRPMLGSLYGGLRG